MTTSSASGYNIGAVSRLTGIARERIRIWERRYDAVVPHRDAGNNRLYSQEDVDRLVLIRRLVDAGHAISQVARLSLAELTARLAAAGPLPTTAAPPRHLLILGPDAELLAAEWRDWGLPSVEPVREFVEAAQRMAHAEADLVIAALPTVTSQEAAALLKLRRAAPKTALLLVYRFAPHRLLDQLARLGVRTVKAPLQRDDLDLVAAPPPTAAGEAQTQDYRERQFTPAQLHRLGRRASVVACDCPQHLANLVRDLQAFEDYTLACEAATPADAALHREVYDVIARARALTEDALGIIAAEEGLIPDTD
jgi:DNA-binding transcriptional MerR regulator